MFWKKSQKKKKKKIEKKLPKNNWKKGKMKLKSRRLHFTKNELLYCYFSRNLLECEVITKDNLEIE